jgi:Predicted ATPase involved in cell division
MPEEINTTEQTEQENQDLKTEETPEAQEAQQEEAALSEEPSPIIDYKDVTIAQDRVVLSNIDLKIKEGEFVYLIGKTGTGKSSLLKSIYADVPLSEGQATVCDMPLKGIRRKDISMLRRKLGIVFQDFQLLQDRNVFDNIAFVLRAIGIKDKEQIEEKVSSTLKDVGMYEKKDVMPYHLSEGEMQRVAIARAIVNSPKLILADEPTGNLDPITSEDILKLLLKINKENNTTILMATHDYIIIEKFPQRVICCEKGKLINA